VKLKQLLFLIVLAFYFLIVNKALADTTQDIVINYPKINSMSPYYQSKRFWEKTVYYFTFSNKSKASFNQELLKERLAELKYVADKRLLSGIETAAKRFSSQAGVSAEAVKNLKDNNKISATVEEFNSYTKILNGLRDLYAANSGYWLAIQQDIDTLKILSDEIKAK